MAGRSVTSQYGAWRSRVTSRGGAGHAPFSAVRDVMSRGGAQLSAVCDGAGRSGAVPAVCPGSDGGAAQRGECLPRGGRERGLCLPAQPRLRPQRSGACRCTGVSPLAPTARGPRGAGSSAVPRRRCGGSGAPRLGRCWCLCWLPGLGVLPCQLRISVVVIVVVTVAVVVGGPPCYC